eukprot:144224_1
MSSTFLQYRSHPQPTLYVMSSSPSKRTHVSYNNTNQQDIIHPKPHESKQSPHKPQTPYDTAYSDHSASHPSLSATQSDRTPYQPHSVDKIHFKSTNRSSHHEVSADNWRIRYYMNLNLVKQPNRLSMQYRSSSLPRPSPPMATNTDTTQTWDRSRKSIDAKHKAMRLEDVPIFIEQEQQHTEEHVQLSTPKTTHKKKSKRIHIIHKTRSQNNTPPRQFPSLLRKHHKRCRLSRLRSRSAGHLSFHGKQKSVSMESNEDDDDNDSISTTEESVNNHHLNALNAIHIKNDSDISTGSNLTPPGTSSKYARITKSKSHFQAVPNTSSHHKLPYPSSRTPPGKATRSVFHTNHKKNHHNPNYRNRFESEPIQYHPQSQSIAVRRSKPLVIHKHKVKPRFDVDFHDATGYQVASPELLFENLNTEYLVDDEANFEMD